MQRNDEKKEITQVVSASPSQAVVSNDPEVIVDGTALTYVIDKETLLANFHEVKKAYESNTIAAIDPRIDSQIIEEAREIFAEFLKHENLSPEERARLNQGYIPPSFTDYLSKYKKETSLAVFSAGATAVATVALGLAAGAATGGLALFGSAAAYVYKNYNQSKPVVEVEPVPDARKKAILKLIPFMHLRNEIKARLIESSQVELLLINYEIESLVSEFINNNLASLGVDDKPSLDSMLDYMQEESDSSSDNAKPLDIKEIKKQQDNKKTKFLNNMPEENRDAIVACLNSENKIKDEIKQFNLQVADLRRASDFSRFQYIEDKRSFADYDNVLKKLNHYSTQIQFRIDEINIVKKDMNEMRFQLLFQSAFEIQKNNLDSSVVDFLNAKKNHAYENIHNRLSNQLAPNIPGDGGSRSLKKLQEKLEQIQELKKARNDIASAEISKNMMRTSELPTVLAELCIPTFEDETKGKKENEQNLAPIVKVHSEMLRRLNVFTIDATELLKKVNPDEKITLDKIEDKIIKFLSVLQVTASWLLTDEVPKVESFKMEEFDNLLAHYQALFDNVDAQIKLATKHQEYELALISQKINAELSENTVIVQTIDERLWNEFRNELLNNLPTNADTEAFDLELKNLFNQRLFNYLQLTKILNVLAEYEEHLIKSESVVNRFAVSAVSFFGVNSKISKSDDYKKYEKLAFELSLDALDVKNREITNKIFIMKLLQKAILSPADADSFLILSELNRLILDDKLIAVAKLPRRILDDESANMESERKEQKNNGNSITKKKTHGELMISDISDILAERNPRLEIVMPKEISRSPAELDIHEVFTDWDKRISEQKEVLGRRF